MPIVELVVDLGSAYTTIFKAGEGVVLHEPTIVLINGKNVESSKIIEYGLDAKKLVAKLPQGNQLLYPVQEGAITYKRATKAMLSHYIKRVVDRNDYFLKPHIRAFVNIPCGAGNEERDLIEEVFIAAGCQEVYLVEAPLFAFYGSGVPIDYSESAFVVDIGGGLTDMALISELGIEKGYSFGIGGLNIDYGIIEKLESSISMKVGMLTSEAIKCDVGSLFINDKTETKVFGKNYVTGMPKAGMVSAIHILPMLQYYYGKIAELVSNVMKELSNETVNYVCEKGIIFTGGASAIPGLQEFMSEKLKTPIIIPKNPGFTSIHGGAMLLSYPKKMNELLRIK